MSGRALMMATGLAAGVAASWVLGGCGHARAFDAGGSPAALGPALAAEFPKGMGRWKVRRRAVELGMALDIAMWARLSPDQAYAPVPLLGVTDYQRWQWASREEAESLSPRATTDFFELSDEAPEGSSREERNAWARPGRGVVMYYDADDRLERVLVGPMVHLHSDRVVQDGFELYGSGGTGE